MKPAEFPVDARLQSEEFMRNPYALYAELRETAPVCWSQSWGCWLLTRHDDVVATLNTPERFSSVRRLTAVFESELPVSFQDRIRPLISHYNTGLINVDGGDHSRLRRLVQQGFTPSAIRRLQDRIREIVRGILAKVALRNGEMDVVRDLAYPLPITVITEMMGVPEAERDDFKLWSSKTVEFMATPRPSQEVLLASNDALVRLRNRFHSLTDERKAHPKDDLVTALVQAREAGDKLTDDEMISTLTTILIGGHETTTNLLGTSLLRLHQNPAEREILRANPPLIRNAVEELLRFDSPFQRNRRVVTEDCELRGQSLRKGQIVLQFLGSANRDPAANPDPDRLDVKRNPVRHVAFGHGAHFCLGAALARLEVQVALEELLTGPYQIEILEDNPVWKNGLLRGLCHLRARVIPRSA
ncbi:MAG: cytochrome [Verrucomicrobia bacterium]|nr:cytochrome [Verrucomicrobiota bacterium]